MSDLISRQAAIDALMEKDKRLRNINWYDKPYAEGECRGIDEALSIISNLPPVTPQPEKRTEERTKTHACVCISRQAALEILDEYAENIESGNLGTAYSKARTSMCELPSVEPERKTGKWIRGEAYPHRIYCSECYKTFIPNDEMRAWVDGDLPRKYCPECGAKMEVNE